LHNYDNYLSIELHADVIETNLKCEYDSVLNAIE